jgi:hypothetical protein
MFLTVVTRPDLAYSVNTVSKFINSHNESHWLAVKRIISYLVETVDIGIEFRASNKGIELSGYSDAISRAMLQLDAQQRGTRFVSQTT